MRGAFHFTHPLIATNPVARGKNLFAFLFQVGRTENIKNCLDPQFTRAFEVDYYFEEVQKLRFAVYDLDNKTPDLSDDDFLGEMECTMGQVRNSGRNGDTRETENGEDGFYQHGESLEEGRGENACVKLYSMAPTDHAYEAPSKKISAPAYC